MKRSPIQRKTLLKARKPLGRGKPMQKAKKARRKVQKDCRWRSEAYLAWVRTLPCCVCGAPADAAHHLIGIWNLSGMGLKAPDSFVMPVCDGPGDTCHRLIHSDASLRWRQPVFVLDTINAGLEQFTSGPIYDALQEALEFVREKTA